MFTTKSHLAHAHVHHSRTHACARILIAAFNDDLFDLSRVFLVTFVRFSRMYALSTHVECQCNWKLVGTRKIKFPSDVLLLTYGMGEIKSPRYYQD
jgi:hypothetical protein